MAVIEYNNISGPKFIQDVTSRDVILIPVSAPENHGAHLPLGTDLYISEALARIAGEIYEKSVPDARAYLFPPVSIGGATIRGAGSVKVRSKDLERGLFFLGKRLIKQGFCRIVLFSGHGGVPHVNAMDGACAKLTRILRRNGGGAAFAPAAKIAGNCFAGVYIDSWQKRGIVLPDDPKEKFLHDIHAGLMETSMMLAVRPDLVDDVYKTLPPILPPKRRWLDGVERAVGLVVDRLPLNEQNALAVKFALRIGKLDLSWILRGRKEGYCGYPHLSNPLFGDHLLRFVSEESAEAMIDIFENGGSPADHNSIMFLFPWVKRAGLVLAALILAGIVWALK